MVRCAYAHGLADPKWEVRGGFRQVLEVDLPGKPLTLDLRKLHGRGFDFDVMGGHTRWFDIRDASLAKISALSALDGGMPQTAALTSPRPR